MSSAQSLREFITERLTAAAAEIFSEFEKTIVRYEEKIDRQRRLLELSWKPQLDLHRIELPLHDVRKDEEVQMGQQLWNQERTSSLDQEQAEHPLVKVEQDEPEPLQILEQGELSISQEDEEQFVLKQEMITSLVTPADEERDQNEPEPDTHQLLFSLFPETETRTAAPPGSTGTTTQPIDTSTLPSSPLHHTEFAQEQSQFGQSYTAPRPPIPHALDPHLSPTPVHQLSRPPHEDGHQGHVFRPSSRLGKTGCASIPCSAAELHILTLLEHIKQQQMQLAVTVNSLAAGRGTETPVPEMPNVNLPLSTLSEVEEFEEWLKDQANSRAKQNMVSVLGAVGGQNPKKTTWNILSRLFSDAVAKQINWKGVNGKKCFKEMLTRSLLIRAVRKNPSSACAADTEIDYFIRWFNLASDRGGGRKERQKAKEASA